MLFVLAAVQLVEIVTPEKLQLVETKVNPVHDVVTKVAPRLVTGPYHKEVHGQTRPLVKRPTPSTV
jgi:hypothetical protein